MWRINQLGDRQLFFFARLFQFGQVFAANTTASIFPNMKKGGRNEEKKKLIPKLVKKKSFFPCILISIRSSEVAVYFPWQGYIGCCCHHTGKKTTYELYTEQWVRVQFKHDIKGTCCYCIILSLAIAASTILSSAIRLTLCENLPDMLSKSNRIKGVAKKMSWFEIFYQEPGFHLLRSHFKSTWFLAIHVEFKVKKNFSSFFSSVFTVSSLHF